MMSIKTQVVAFLNLCLVMAGDNKNKNNQNKMLREQERVNPTPPYRKMAITPKNDDPKEPKLFDFSYISMTKPPIPFLGAQNGEKRGFYSIFGVDGTIFWIKKFVFLAFFEAKITKIVILDQKLIVHND